MDKFVPLISQSFFIYTGYTDPHPDRFERLYRHCSIRQRIHIHLIAVDLHLERSRPVHIFVRYFENICSCLCGSIYHSIRFDRFTVPCPCECEQFIRNIGLEFRIQCSRLPRFQIEPIIIRIDLQLIVRINAQRILIGIIQKIVHQTHVISLSSLQISIFLIPVGHHDLSVRIENNDHVLSPARNPIRRRVGSCEAVPCDLSLLCNIYIDLLPFLKHGITADLIRGDDHIESNGFGIETIRKTTLNELCLCHLRDRD